MSDRPPRAQALILTVLAVCLLLTGCGKRASRLDPPPDVTVGPYPHIYPNTDTDPAPTYQPAP